jgi:transcriptional regulator GlxA family with amidase domain
MGLSTRQLERRFAAHWGMSPKQFQVIARLNGALGQAVAMEPGPGGQGAALAVDQGYYDQSHLARDVRRLAGQPLQALVQGAHTPFTAHWPLQIGAQAQHAPPAQPREPEPVQGASRNR